jgi:formylglycine-generating enzyme
VVTRTAGAKWFLPTEDEWYKAAYYDPKVEHYWEYATGSDTLPNSAPPGSPRNTANYYGGTTGYAVNGSLSYSNSQNYLTDVGAYTASASPYGTFDQSGNVFQWNEAIFARTLARGARGGSWDSEGGLNMPSSYRALLNPTSKFVNFGFRVASIPEPGSIALCVVGAVTLMLSIGTKQLGHCRSRREQWVKPFK